MDTTQGTLLDGRLRYEQPAQGWRTGIEPVLLAASIQAQPGQRVLEAGTGAAAALLCLLARTRGIIAHGIENDPAMAQLARANLAANTLQATIHTADVAIAPSLAPIDHAFANPPWHDPASTPSPDPARAKATHRSHHGLQTWIAALAACLTPAGTLTLALPAAQTAEALSLLLAAGLGRTTLVPLWPKPATPAKLILLQARRGRADSRIHPGLLLHAATGYTPAAELILRSGAALDL